MTPNPQELFDAHYYEHGCGPPYEHNDHWLSFFGTVADHIASSIKPNTVLDAGCAMGFLVETLRERQVEAFGIDISEYAIANVSPDTQAYCSVQSVTKPLSREYDLIVCIEVLEHLQKEESEQAISNLCQYSDDILFSSTPFDLEEATHFNVQPPEYWAEQFAQQGFFRDVDYDASFLTPWAVRFRRQDKPYHQVTRDYERRLWALLTENADLQQRLDELKRQLLPAQTVPNTQNHKLVEQIRLTRRWLMEKLRGTAPISKTTK